MRWLSAVSSEMAKREGERPLNNHCSGGLGPGLGDMVCSLPTLSGAPRPMDIALPPLHLDQLAQGSRAHLTLGGPQRWEVGRKSRPSAYGSGLPALSKLHYLFLQLYYGSDCCSEEGLRGFKLRRLCLPGEGMEANVSLPLSAGM